MKYISCPCDMFRFEREGTMMTRCTRTEDVSEAPTLTPLASGVSPASYSFHRRSISRPTSLSPVAERIAAMASLSRLNFSSSLTWSAASIVRHFCSAGAWQRSTRRRGEEGRGMMLTPQWGEMSPTMASARSCTMAILMQRCLQTARHPRVKSHLQEKTSRVLHRGYSGG